MCTVWLQSSVICLPITYKRQQIIDRDVTFVDIFFSVLCLLCLCARLFIVSCGHLIGKSRPLGSRLWCITVILSLSNWHPGSGVVLVCIDS